MINMKHLNPGDPKHHILIQGCETNSIKMISLLLAKVYLNLILKLQSQLHFNSRQEINIEENAHSKV